MQRRRHLACAGAQKPVRSAQKDAEHRQNTPCPDLRGSHRVRAGRPGWARGSRPPPGAAEQPGHWGPAERRSRRRVENLCRRPCPGAKPSFERSTRGPACARGRPVPRSPRAPPEFAARSRQDGASSPGSAPGPAPLALSSPVAAAAALAGAGNSRG